MSLLIIGLTGCTTATKIPTDAAVDQPSLTARQQTILTVTPPHLHAQYTQLWQQGENNAVLNWMELGTRAFHTGEYHIAEQAFDSALAGIEAIYQDDPYAEQARSLWYDEGRKQYKGEPYERAMAYLYRGLLYLMNADYGNARASFESGVLQDAFAEESQFRADFKSLYFLSAWAAAKFGNSSQAQQAYDDLLSLEPEVEIPSPEHNVLVVVMFGDAPRKLADGVGHTRLVYRPAKKAKGRVAHSPRIVSDEQHIVLIPLDNLFYQASTRGGRQVDAIIDGKLAFRESSADIGSSASTLGDKIAESTRRSTTGQDKIGRYVAASRAIAALATGIGARVKPEADIRQWSNLPGILYVATTSLPLSTPSIIIEFEDERGVAIEQQTQTIPIHFDQHGNALVVASTQYGPEP